MLMDTLFLGYTDSAQVPCKRWLEIVAQYDFKAEYPSKLPVADEDAQGVIKWL